MSRYIDADALLENMKRTDRYFAVKFDIEEMPTADVVEVRHGSWGFDGIGWTCSECGEYALSNKTKMQVHSIYCPHCGAKMDGERKER